MENFLYYKGVIPEVKWEVKEDMLEVQDLQQEKSEIQFNRSTKRSTTIGGKMGMDSQQQPSIFLKQPQRKFEEPNSFEAFKKQLSQQKRLKNMKYYKKRGRKRKDQKDFSMAVPDFLVTEEIKEKVKSVKDTRFGSTGNDYDITRGSKYVSHQAIRAVQQKNYELLSKIFNENEAHNPFVDRAADCYYNAFDVAIWNEDFKAVKMILDFFTVMNASEVFSTRVRIKSNLQHRGHGSYSMYTYGRRIKEVNMSRGSREGNNAFTGDYNLYKSVHRLNIQTHLDRALRKGKLTIKMLELFLKEGQLNVTIDLLDAALMSGNAEIAEFLARIFLKSGGYGLNKLHVQALHLKNDEEFEKYRLNQSVKKSSMYTWTPVHFAAINPNTGKFLQELLDLSISNKNLLDGHSKSPVHYAAVSKCPENLLVLIQMGADLTLVDQNEQTPLILAAKLGREKNVELICQNLEETVNMLDSKGMSALHYAAKYGHLESIKALFECEGINVNIRTYDKITPVHLAAQQGHLEVLKFFKENNFDMKAVDKNGKNALIYAAKNLHLEVMKYLILECGLNPHGIDSSLNSIVHYCAGYDFLDGINLLEACGLNLNVFNSWKTSALQIAMLKNNWCIFDHILESEGIDINAKDDQGKTMVFLLLEKKDEFFMDQVLHLIEKKNAHVDVKSADGNTLTHLIASNPHEDDLSLLKFLFKLGASLEEVNDNGVTPLEIAIQSKNFPIFQFILNNLKNYDLICKIDMEKKNENIMHKLLRTVTFKRPKNKEEKGIEKLVGKVPRSVLMMKAQKKTFQGGFDFGGGGFSHPQSGFGGGFSSQGVSVGFSQPKSGFSSQGGFNFGGGFSKKQKIRGNSNNQSPNFVSERDTKYYDLFIKKVKEEEKGKEKIKELLLSIDNQGKTPIFRLVERFINPDIFEIELFKSFIKELLNESKSKIDDHVVKLFTQKKAQKQKKTKMGRKGRRKYRYNNFNITSNEQIGKTPLMISFERESLNMIDFYLEIHSNINQKDKNGKTVLHYAVEKATQNYSKYNLVEKLLVAGCDATVKDNKNRTIIHTIFIDPNANNNNWGWSNQSKEPIELLSDLNVIEGINLDDVDIYGRSALHYSSIKGYTIMSMFLVDNGADVNKKDEDGNTPLGLALLKGHVDFSVCLINKGANLKDHIVECSDINISQKAYLQKMKEQEEKNKEMADSNVGSGFSSSYAPQKKFKRTARKSTKWGGYNQNENKEETGKLSIFKFIANKNWTGLFFLCLSRDISIHEGVKDLLDIGKVNLLSTVLKKTRGDKLRSLNDKNENLFHILAQNSHLQDTEEMRNIIKDLVVKYKVSVDQINSDGLNPFFVACYYKNYLMIKYLLIDPVYKSVTFNLKDGKKNNITPLIYLAINNEFDIINLLLNSERKNKLDINLVDDLGRSAIFYTIQNNEIGSFQNVKMFDLFVKNGAKIDMLDKFGNSLVFYLKLQKRKDMLQHCMLKFPLTEVNDPKIDELVEKKRKEMQEEVYGVFKSMEYVKHDVEADYGKKFNSVLIESNKKKEKLSKEEKIEKLKKIHTPSNLASVPKGSFIEYNEKMEFYDINLLKTDLGYGMFGYNNFYKLQVIKNPHQDLWLLFNNYGRAGESGQFQITPYPTKEECVKEFEKIFKAKTRNTWEEYLNGEFKKKRGKYRVIEMRKINYEKKMLKELNLKDFAESKIVSTGVKNLILRSFDIKLMKEKMRRSYKIDTKIFDLGNLSKVSIKNGMNILNKISDNLDTISILTESSKRNSRYSYTSGFGSKTNKEDEEKEKEEAEMKKSDLIDEITELSNEFYSLIPTTKFRNNTVTPILDKPSLKANYEMLDSLLEFEETIKLMIASQANKEISPIDYVYHSLDTHLVEIKDGKEYDMIFELIKKNSDGQKMNNKTIISVFKVQRETGENDKFKQYESDENRMLLFHGTKSSNVLSILKKGLIKNPRNVFKTGELFGRGLYFSDSFSKSVGYCYEYGNVGVMLICEVALGKTFKTFHPGNLPNLDFSDITLNGIGVNGPKQNQILYRTLDGVKIPLGCERRDDESLILQVIENQKKFEGEIQENEKKNLVKIKMCWSNKNESFEVEVSENDTIMKLKKKVIETLKENEMYTNYMTIKMIGSVLHNEMKISKVIKSLKTLTEGTHLSIQVPQGIERRFVQQKGFKKRPGMKMKKGFFKSRYDEINVGRPSIQYNEFIVNNVDRIKIRYMIEFHS